MLDSPPYPISWFISNSTRLDATFENEYQVKYRVLFVSFLPNSFNIEIVIDDSNATQSVDTAASIKFISTLWEVVRQVRTLTSLKYLIAASQSQEIVTFLNTALAVDIHKYDYRLIDPQDYASLDPYIQEVMNLTEEAGFTPWLIENILYSNNVTE